MSYYDHDRVPSLSDPPTTLKLLVIGKAADQTHLVTAAGARAARGASLDWQWRGVGRMEAYDMVLTGAVYSGCLEGPRACEGAS